MLSRELGTENIGRLRTGRLYHGVRRQKLEKVAEEQQELKAARYAQRCRCRVAERVAGQAVCGESRFKRAMTGCLTNLRRSTATPHTPQGLLMCRCTPWEQQVGLQLHSARRTCLVLVCAVVGLPANMLRAVWVCIRKPLSLSLAGETSCIFKKRSSGDTTGPTVWSPGLSVRDACRMKEPSP